ncbi:MAG: S1C family serine protease, partial [Oscillospiraceae bacterium]|nr:S1C family serine protease [Oscillospiraceae bacterium]
IVGFDSRTDVGLLRVKATGLEGAEFGDSDMLKVGEPIYAIGNPGGVEFKGSFTNGMVSAIDRAITSKYKMKTIQHTAAINPGNSGGALVNTLGQVVGVNSQKIVDTEYEGMGFAIPSKTVQEVVNNLIAKGYVPNRPKLGIQYLPATQTQAGNWVVRSNSLPSGSLIIAKIDEGSDIQGTQVRTNDIITHVNGNPLNKPDVLLQAVENGKVGDELKLTIARVNSNYTVESFNVSVKLMEDKGTVTEPETQPWFYDEFGAQSGW